MKAHRTKILYIFIFFLGVNKLIAQKVFSVKYKSDADVKVFVVDNKSKADLIVYKTKYASNAKGNNGLWFFADYKSQADKKVFFVDYKSQANLLIYFQDYKSQAGWKNNSKNTYCIDSYILNY